MRTLSVIASRAVGRMCGRFTSYFALALFFAVSGALFAYRLLAAEGMAVSVPSIWALAQLPVLPVLVSLLSMHLWDGDGAGGELDLVVPVPEREFAIGRFAAVYGVTVAASALSLSVPLFLLPHFAPALAPRLSVVRFLPAFSALAIFVFPLAAIGSAVCAFFRRPVSAAVASFAVTAVVPVAIYRFLLEWSPLARMKFAEFPVSAQVADASDGFFSSGAAMAAFAFAGFAVYAASKAFATRRFAGSGSGTLRFSSLIAAVSALLAASLFSAVAMRLDCTVEWPGASRTAAFSARTREILSGTSKPVRVTAYIRRDAPEFLPVARLLRALAAEARASGGAEVTYRFIDPRWDPNAAARLVRSGVSEGSIVFASGRRRIPVPVADADESVCASAVQRLSMPDRLETVLFVTGHGEPSVSDYSPSGLADAVRALRQEGYRTGTVFTPTSAVPDECAVLVCAGARTPFSAAEMRELERYLSSGGRILAALSPDMSVGAGPLLERLGVSVSDVIRPSSGGGIVVSEFGDHPVSRALEDVAVAFALGTAAFSFPHEQETGKTGYEFTRLCASDAGALAFAAEKGAGLGDDLAIRPARLAVIGDASFFVNGAFESRANANRDFFLNAVAWLAGMDVSGSSGTSGDVLSARMHRDDWMDFALSAACLPPVAVMALGLLFMRRKRKWRNA